MTDRALLVALFNLVGALTERLTHDKFVLCVEDESGNVTHLYSDTSKVTWVGAAESPSAGSQESGHKHCLIHDAQYATLRGS